MRLFGRNDLILMTGLSIALFVVFSPVVAGMLDYVEALDRRSGLQLLPALVILATVFLFVQAWKRREIRAEASRAADIMRLANERASEMERLVQFGQALTGSLHYDDICAAAATHLPLLASGRTAWAMSVKSAQWQPLIPSGDAQLIDLERAARTAIGDADTNDGANADDVCFPMVIAGMPVGVLGVSPSPLLSDQQRSVLTTAAALLAASLKNAALFREVHENSVRDALTGCFNRKHTLEFLETELRRARRSQTPLSLVMFDLDHFKRINDTRGHLGGDAVLAAVGGRMKSVLRGGDVKCRYGGEEFLVVLPDTPSSGGKRVAETLRREIGEQPVMWGEEDIHVTASFGVTSIVPGETDAFAVMARADAALYRAKQRGRNCVQVAEAPGILSAVQSPLGT